MDREESDAPYGLKADGTPRKRPLAGATASRLGRPKGAANKVSVAIRDDILMSYVRLGGVAYLEQLGREEPAIYARLLQACIPRDVNLSVRRDTAQLLDRFRRQPELVAEKLRELRSRLSSSPSLDDFIEVKAIPDGASD
jgi:hypothetical protein